eukprot:6492581-Amphidinium_carterae.1
MSAKCPNPPKRCPSRQQTLRALRVLLSCHIHNTQKYELGQPLLKPSCKELRIRNAGIVAKRRTSACSAVKKEALGGGYGFGFGSPSAAGSELSGFRSVSHLLLRAPLSDAFASCHGVLNASTPVFQKARGVWVGLAPVKHLQIYSTIIFAAISLTILLNTESGWGITSHGISRQIGKPRSRSPPQMEVYTPRGYEAK